MIYGPDADRSFASLGGGLCVAGDSGVSIFSASGTCTCSLSFNFSEPVVRAGDKYALIFENGGNSYYLFNMFSRVYSGSSDYPVTDAGISADGSYYLISSAEGYTSALLLYNSDFKLTTSYLTNSYIVAADITPDGNGAVCAVLDVDEKGEYICTLLKISAGSDTAESKNVLSGVFPLALRCTDSGYILVSTERIYRFENGSEKSNLSHDQSDITDICVCGDSLCLLSLEDGGSSRLYCLSLTDTLSGNTSYIDIDSTFCSVCSSGKYPCVLCDTGLYLFDGTELTPVECSKPYSSSTRLVSAGDGLVYLAGKSAAYAVITAETE